VGEGRVERTTTVAPMTDVPPGHGHPSVEEWNEALGLCAGDEIPANRTLAVATHRVGAVVLAADAERHAGGEDAVESGSGSFSRAGRSSAASAS
jgi:hypothetical protein